MCIRDRVGGVHHAAHEAQIIRQQRVAVIHDHHARRVELQALFICLLYTSPAPLPDTITISGLTLDIDGIALVFRFVPSVSGEGYEWSASCAPDNNGLTSVEMTTDGGICTVRLLNVSQYDGVTLSATVTNGTESRSICLATDIRVGENRISWDPQL